MKEILEKKIRSLETPGHRLNALREGLQHLILKGLDDGGFFTSLSFTGGTALRVLYDLRRFSEDMDFSLQKPHESRFHFVKMMETLTRQLQVYGFAVDTKAKQTGAVHSLFLRFKGILQEWGISRREGQKLAIKVEVDTNPPEGARFKNRIVQRDFLFSVIHHDLPTLFAGKILAFLHRKYTKGRDVYDLIWYLSRKTAVNRRFLENGLFQSSGEKLSWTETELAARLVERVQSLDLPLVVRDLLPFLDDPAETRLFEKHLILGLIGKIGYV